MPEKAQYNMHHGGSRRITSSGLLLNYIKRLKIILKDRYLIGGVFDATRWCLSEIFGQTHWFCHMEPQSVSLFRKMVRRGG